MRYLSKDELLTMLETESDKLKKFMLRALSPLELQENKMKSFDCTRRKTND